MTRQPTVATFAALAAACLTAPAWGAIDLDIVSVDNSAGLTGYATSDLQITTPDLDWTGAALLLELTAGSIYQEPEGWGQNGSTLGAPDPAGFGVFPSSEFDTYFDGNGHTITFAGGAGDVGGDTLQYDTAQLDAAWYGMATNDTGTFNIARITLSDNATGSWSLALTDEDFKTGQYEFGGTIENGEVISQAASQFNGMTFVEAFLLEKKLYLMSIGIKFDEQGNRIQGPGTPMTLTTSEPDVSLATLPEPGALAAFGVGLTLCMSGRRRVAQG